MEVTVGNWRYPLIPRNVFPKEMPRYPNVWFFITQRFAPTYKDALKILFQLFDLCLLYRVNWRAPFEGADGEAARDHWQPYANFPNPILAHEHSMHLRYFSTPLRNTLFTVVGDDSYACWAVALSVHFEPGGYVHYLSMATHSELENCPYCGRPDKNIAFDDIYERLRDPLGRELLIEGKIKGQRIKDAFGRESYGLADITNNSDAVFIKRIDTINGYFSKGMNTPQISYVFIHS